MSRKKTVYGALISLFLLMGGCQMEMVSKDMAADNLRCQYLIDPETTDAVPVRLSWQVQSDQRGARQTAYQILVADSLESLSNNEGNLWDSGKVISDRTCHVPYGGKALSSYSQCYWKVRIWDQNGLVGKFSRPARWSMGILEPAEWKARWIGAPPMPPEQRDGKSHVVNGQTIDPPIPPCPLLRKSFVVEGRIKRAMVYVTSLGVYELRINGRRVGDHLLAPGYTDYPQRINYQTFDVTGLVCRGDNVIGAILADGWYAGRLGPIEWFPDYPRRGVYGFDRRLLMQLRIELADGKSYWVVSDGSWKICEEGPIRSADLFLGEWYDTGKEQPGWDAPGYNDNAWHPVTVDSTIKTNLTAQENDPIRITTLLNPVSVREYKPGVFIFDMGQNMVGWTRLRLSGTSGQTVIVRHAEMLDDDGGIYTANLKSALQTDRYDFNGDSERLYEPHFTYHCFRYVEISGLEKKPELDQLTGCVFHSDAQFAGKFECSSPMLNRLWQNILWTQRGNMHSIPTDCPNRSERMGWMGDAQVFSQTSIFNMDMAAFYTKWCRDMRDAQNDKGFFSNYSPDPCKMHYGAPGWSDAGVIVPWRVYQNYEDTEILKEQFDAARRYVDAIAKKRPNFILDDGTYGDWLNGDTLNSDDYPKTGGEVPSPVYGTAFFAYSADTLSRMAAVLGRYEYERKYAELAEKVKAAFVDQFVDSDGKINGDTQAGYALALHFDLLPDTLRPRAARHMADAVKKYDYRISTGIQATLRLMLELTRWGYNDLAYKLIESRRFPSWLYSIDQGATTIWERWDGYVKGRGFQGPVMNSFNHYAIGAVGEWMYRIILGLNPDDTGPGYKRFIIHPQPGGSATWARGEYQSIRGRIAIDWRMENSRFYLNLTIPPNTQATVYLPTSRPENAFLDGDSLNHNSLIRNLHVDHDHLIFEAPAGTYRLVCE